MTAEKLQLDYFKLYDVENVPAKYRLTLKGQFDKEPVQADLTVLDFFANPVSKNGERLFDKRAHLTAYRLLQQQREPIRTIRFANQFGEFELRTGGAFALLAPCMKREAGLDFPKETGHYKVYWVIEPGRALDQTVKLKDQFRSEETTIGAPLFFAVPVEKKYRRSLSPILNPKAHLVIYQIKPRDIQKQITIKDQFQERGLTVVRSLFLAVPSLKLRWKA